MESSAVEKLSRIKDNILAHEFPERVELMKKLRDMVKRFDSNPSNLKKYDLDSQQHLHLPINSFKKDHRGTRISAMCNLVISYLRLKKATEI